MTYRQAMAALTDAERCVNALRATCTEETLPKFREALAKRDRLADIAHDAKNAEAVNWIGGLLKEQRERLACRR